MRMLIKKNLLKIKQRAGQLTLLCSKLLKVHTHITQKISSFHPDPNQKQNLHV